MKKLLTTIALVAGILIAGCTTLSNLTPAQIESISVVITQTANQGAVYAIQKDPNNAQYFQLANAALDTFVLGTDLSPAALQAALANVSGNNQWVSLAVSAVVIAYDVSYHTYISGHVNNNPVAKAWITAVETGFKQALAQTEGGTLRAGQVTAPYFVKDDGTLNKDAIAAKVKAANR